MHSVDIALFQTACAFTLTTRRFSNRRQGNINSVIGDADKKRLKLTKKLIECQELDDIIEHQNKTYKWCIDRCVPSYFKTGLYLVKIDQVQKFEEKLKESQRVLLEDLVPKFAVAYPAAVLAARKTGIEGGLGDQFDATDYPTTPDIAGSFGMEWNWIAFGVPDNLPEELKAAEKAKIEAQFQEATTEIMTALREGFHSIVSHVTERLEAGPGERKKIFRDTLFEDLSTFMETFSSRNLTNDNELASLVEQSKEIMAKVKGDSPKDQAQIMRSSEELRATTADAFSKLRKAVDGIIVERVNRKFDFSEDKEVAA